LDGYSRFLVHWDLRERMTEADIEIVRTSPIFVGTSATVGSGPDVANDMARFASSLFSAPFKTDQILFGKTTQVLATNGVAAVDQLAELSGELAKYARRRPHLFRLIAGQLSVDDEPDWDSHIANDLEELAILLDACWEGIDKDVRNLDLLSHDPYGRSRQLLGQIIQRSKAAHSLADLIQTNETVTVDLVELVAQFFKRKNGETSRVRGDV
jgi:hypothetical protein